MINIEIRVADVDGDELKLSTCDENIVLEIEGRERIIPITKLQRAFQALSYATPGESEEEDEDDDEI